MTAAATAPGLLSLSRAAGLALDQFRAEHVEACIPRALEREGVPDAGALARLLVADPDARARFRASVANSFSGLFRDAAQFDLLERELLPELLAGSRQTIGGGPALPRSFPELRIWSAGCADGSELYSVAVVLERLGALERSFLLGSDLLDENLAVARRGVYGDVAVSKRLRRRVRWEQRDVLSAGAPPGRWRLVLCRNVAIYLTPAARRALHETLAGSLAPGGALLLGRSERLGDPASLGLERVVPHAYRRVA